ncbi:MAG: glycosyltransferase [Candidatus Omnitrophota bacterium]|nr:glycosyltransferase [Candidatus Omnitrophota bacterium]
MPAVSIIMATYNHAEFIENAVRSVLAQTFQDFELIIVDDGSTDNTGKIVQENIKSEKIKYCYQKNMGAAGARNNGLRMAVGEFVVFFDSDDLLYPKYLERQIETMRRAESDMAVCDFDLVYWDGTRKNVIIGIQSQDQFYQWIIQNQSPPVATMIKRNVVAAAGFFDESLFNTEDYDLFLRILAGGAVVAHTHETLCDYTIHKVGISEQIENKIKDKAKIINKLSRMLMEKPGLLRKEQLKALMDKNRVYFQRCLALNIDTASTMPEAVRFMEKQYSERRGMAPFLVKCLGYPRYNQLIFIKNSLMYRGYGEKILDQELAWRRKKG